MQKKDDDNVLVECGKWLTRGAIRAGGFAVGSLGGAVVGTCGGAAAGGPVGGAIGFGAGFLTGGAAGYRGGKELEQIMGL